MNNTVTYQITVQPWQITPLCTVRLTRASYNKHGRQIWETICQREARQGQLEEEIHELVDRVLVLEANWRLKIAGHMYDSEAGLSDQGGRLWSDGVEQREGSGDLAGTTDESDAEDEDDEPWSRFE